MVDKLSKAFCTRALSADAEREFETDDSGDTALVLLVRAMCGFCAQFRALGTPPRSVMLAQALKSLFGSSKAFCTRAISADADGGFEKADSGSTALVLPVRAVRIFCAHAEARLIKLIKKIWGADEHPFTIFTPDGLGEFLIGPVVSLGGDFVDSISIREGSNDVPRD